MTEINSLFLTGINLNQRAMFGGDDDKF